MTTDLSTHFECAQCGHHLCKVCFFNKFCQGCKTTISDEMLAAYDQEGEVTVGATTS